MVLSIVELALLRVRLGIWRFAADAPTPAWAVGEFVSVTRTQRELSVVAPEESAPPDLRGERGWRALEVAGPLDFALTGVLAALTAPLAAAEIAVFTVSTYDTDYLLVKDDLVERAVAALTASGHAVRER